MEGLEVRQMEADNLQDFIQKLQGPQEGHKDELNITHPLGDSLARPHSSVHPAWNDTNQWILVLPRCLSRRCCLPHLTRPRWLLRQSAT